jgi:4-amino-4-deoxy-L-arabinose transferase-like glycosyltransferase
LPEPIIYALCWFAAIFIFFSSSHGKCLVYILPAFPPLAALTGWAIAETAQTGAEDPLLTRIFAVGSVTAVIGVLVTIAVALVIGIFGVPAKMLLHLHPTDRRFLDIFTTIATRRSVPLTLWLAAFFVGAMMIITGLVRHNVSGQALGMAAVAAAGSLFWFAVMNATLAERESLKAFAREVITAAPPETRIGHIGIEDCDLYFYSTRPIEPVFGFRCDTASQFPPYIVIRKERFFSMDATQRACLKVALESPPVDSHGPRLLLEQTRAVK